MFEWKDSFSVGVRSLDAEHRNLFALAREMHVAVATGKGKATIAKLLDRLIQYTSVHFAHEERLMEKGDYPQLAEHKVQHEALKAEVSRFQEEYLAGRVTMTADLLRFLKDWLEKHIQESDRQYTPFVRDSPSP